MAGALKLLTLSTFFPEITMRQRTFPVYADPGHAWIKVPKTFLSFVLGHEWRLNFSSCSHERGEHVYLEEDRDASVLIEACKVAGVSYKLHPVSCCARRYSRIRNYSPLLSA